MPKPVNKRERSKLHYKELNSGLRAHFFHSIEQLNTTDWDQLANSSHLFLRSAYLKVFEKTAPEELKFYYVVISSNTQVLAILYFQVLQVDADTLTTILKPLAEAKPVPVIGSSWSEWIRKCREEKGFRLLISGNNFVSGEYGMAHSGNFSEEKTFETLAEVVKHITKVDRDPVKISAILVKDYHNSDSSKGIQFLKRFKYHLFQVEPEMIVQLRPEWHQFRDYIAAMSKKYRNRAKTVLLKTEQLNVVEFGHQQIESYKDELYALYRQVHQRAKFRLAHLQPDYFVQLKIAFPERFRFIVYKLDGKIVSFRTAFQIFDAESSMIKVIESHFIGFDYLINTKMPLYQRILYDFVADGIQYRASAVHMGRTAAEMKSTIGAVANDLICCIRHRNGLSNQIIRPFIDYLKPSVWIPRNPFARNYAFSEGIKN